MKVFTQEVNNCSECNFFNENYDFCEHIKKGTLKHWDKNEYCNTTVEINDMCPFNKSLIKEDIESFGFKYTENENVYILKIKLFVIKIFPKIGKNRFVIEQYIKNSKMPLSKGLFIITSKPHLKFILQILNTIE